MNIYIPFTYIIGWSQQKQFYYGCKYAQGCQPSDLWESYFTSSEYVEEFRKENGEPDIVKIHRTFKDKDSCVLFEHEYLSKIDAKNHPLFLNKSNGGKDFGPLGEETNEKRKRTCMKKFGYDSNLQSPEVKEQIKKTCSNKYGVEYSGQAESVKRKRKQTCLKKYGVEYSLQSDEIKEKIKKTHFSNTGYYCNLQDPETINKIKKTCLDKYGSENVFQNEEIQKRQKQTCLSIYGVENVFQNKEIKDKIKQSFIYRYGVDNPGKRVIVCKYCGETKNINHESKCKNNPNRNIADKKGKNNPNVNYYKVVSPSGDTILIVSKSELLKFAKQNGLVQKYFVKNEVEGWTVEIIKKDNQ